MRTREERPRKCRKQRPGQTAPQFEDEELWGSTLDSVLSSVPLQDIQASFWAVLGKLLGSTPNTGARMALNHVSFV